MVGRIRGQVVEEPVLCVTLKSTLHHQAMHHQQQTLIDSQSGIAEIPGSPADLMACQSGFAIVHFRAEMHRSLAEVQHNHSEMVSAWRQQPVSPWVLCQRRMCRGATIQDLESHIGPTGLVFNKYDLVISGMVKSGGKLQWNNSIW